jgi:hypothetical protein
MIARVDRSLEKSIRCSGKGAPERQLEPACPRAPPPPAAALRAWISPQTSQVCPTSRCCRMRCRQRRWAFCCRLLPGSTARASAAKGCSPITAVRTTPDPGEKHAQHWDSHQNTPGLTPRTNGKAERFIQTLLAEWAYSMAFQT